jgi:glucans biosynthesis protein C
MIVSLAPALRFHALDSLRAAMMFLGIYLHAVVAYSPNGGCLLFSNADLLDTLSKRA